MADFDREASRVRRDEIRRKVNGSVEKVREGNPILADLLGLVDDGDALESALVAADREVAELRDKNRGRDEQRPAAAVVSVETEEEAT